MTDTYVIEDIDQRKEIIEELKVVQDILLKQEAYALGALHQALVIIAGLILALLSEKTKMDSRVFLVISEAIFLGFLYVQTIYREAFYRGLDRSHYLQRLLGGRIPITEPAYESFKIYENVHHPRAKWGTFRVDINNPRFFVPNAMIFAIPFIVVWLRHA